MLERPRLRLQGKRATRDELVTEIVSLLNCTSVRRPYPLSITEVAKIFSVSRQTIYTYLKAAKEKVSMAVSDNLLKWIDSQIKKRRFANRSHAFEYAVQLMMEKSE